MESQTWKPEPVARGGKRTAEARKQVATGLFSRGLTFVGQMGASNAVALLSGKGLVMPNGKQVTLADLPCPFCGSYNGKAEPEGSTIATRSTRLANAAIFTHGEGKEAKYVFVSAGSAESCLSKYVAPAKVKNGADLKAAYPGVF